MGFASGSVTFRRFKVVGKHPSAIDQSILDKLHEFRLQLGEYSVPEEVEYGWCGARHILDSSFSFEHNVFGDALFFGLRVDTNRVPASLKKAYQLMEEQAVAASNPSGFISKTQKRDVKEIVRQKVEDELKDGKFRRSKLVPILWDFSAAMLYCAAAGPTQEKLLEIFPRTFDLELEPVSAGTLGLDVLEGIGRRRDYEDTHPTRFVIGPEGEGIEPEYPWVAKGAEPKDFLGNEFLLWLWYQADAGTGTVVAGKAGEVAIILDRSLDLECAYGVTGRDSFKSDGVSRMTEAAEALRVGKLPRKSAMILNALGHQYELSFNPELFYFSTVKLPEVEEAESPRVLFEERITLLRDLCQIADELFRVFLDIRAGSRWEGVVSKIRHWINRPAGTSAD